MTDTFQKIHALRELARTIREQALAGHADRDKWREIVVTTVLPGDVVALCDAILEGKHPATMPATSMNARRLLDAFEEKIRRDERARCVAMGLLPAGWKPAPENPTTEMKVRGGAAIGNMDLAHEAWVQMMQAVPTVPERRVWHQTRGSSYVVLGEGEVQISTGRLCAFDPDTGRKLHGREIVEGETLTVYRDDCGKIWLRPPEEFGDGRFQETRRHEG